MYILFDIGGTKTRIAATKDKETCTEPVVIETPKDFTEGVRAVGQVAKKIAGGEPIRAAVGGVAGVFTKERTGLVNAPNLRGWVGKPLVSELRRAIGAPEVHAHNDTVIIGLGELAKSGMRDGIFAYLTVSTGVGGARFVNGEIDETAFGFEPGHLIIDPDNSMCPDCPGNTFEDYVSGTGVAKRFGRKAYQIDRKDVWEELARFLAYGLHDVVVTWSPERMVLGGSMIVGDPAIPLETTKKELKKILTIFPHIPDIQKAQLGDFGGIYGALQYIKQYNL